MKTIAATTKDHEMYGRCDVNQESDLLGSESLGEPS